MAIPAAGYVGAAVIAASAAFIGMILGKEQKTTEFRQEWINAQRDDIACMVARAKAAIPPECKSERAKALREFDEAHTRVRLRENPTTEEWKWVLKELDRLRQVMVEERYRISSEASEKRVVELSRVLLKIEWMRVRRGESWFAQVKWLLPAVIALTVWALAYGKEFIVISFHA